MSILEQKLICPICDQDKFTLVTTKIREGEGRIVRCEGCGLVAQDLNWDQKKISQYYQDEYQTTNSLDIGDLQTPRKHFEDRLKTINPIFEMIKPLLKPQSRVLEIGCGAGELLHLIKPHVKKCVGTELNADFVKFANDELGVEAYAEDINQLSLNQTFDLIISIATIDHMPRPFETMLTIKKLLNPGGKIYLEVPNLDQALNVFLPLETKEKFLEFFWHRAHFHYYNRDTITKLYQKAGFKIHIDCRHDYTFKNFLQWYYLGRPQKGYVLATRHTGLFDGQDAFEVRMNEMFDKMDQEFRTIMKETLRGESLCCTGWL